MKISQHARTRMQQRGIDPFVLELALRFGRKHYDHHGGVRRVFDKPSRRRIQKDLGKNVYEHIRPLLDTVVIHDVAEQTVITVAHRLKRVRLAH